MNYAICFLVINDMQQLPRVAINSVLKNSEAPIYVGYVNEVDVAIVPKHSRVKLIHLKPFTSNQRGKYQDFGTSGFYEAVYLKWSLFLKLLDLNYDFVIYNDLDVVWLRNAGEAMKNFFNRIERIDLAFQSFTRDPVGPLLCMGFFAFRNTDFSRRFIRECESEHLAAIESGLLIGDDEIVTKGYIDSGFSEKFWELPQSTFAVGNFLDLYLGRSRMPGVNKPKPIIFHANYVVGLHNKLFMLRLMLGKKRSSQLGLKIQPNKLILQYLRRIKQGLRWLRLNNSPIRQRRVPER
jgi:hypothetical protein